MSIPVEIIGVDKDSQKVICSLHHKKETNVGVVAYTEPLRDWETQYAPF